MNPRIQIILAIVLSILGAFDASAGLRDATGQVVIVPARSDVANGRLESNTQILAFEERSDTVLTHNVAVDITAPGVSPNATDANLSPGVISTGTAVRSYFLHADVIGSPTVENAVNLSGSVSFDHPVLGIIALSESLNDTNNYPGRPGVNYAFNSQRGLEFNPAGGGTSDFLTLSADRLTISVNLRGGPNVDQVRVLTAIPEPTSLGLFLIPFALFTRARSSAPKGAS